MTYSSIYLATICFILSFVSSTTIDYSCLHANSWKVNTNGHYNSYFATATDCTFSYYSSGPPGIYLWTAKFTGIPNYDRTFTSTDVTKLNSRPKASSDFASGVTTASAGSYIVFGQNVGYTSTACTMGYWPPGPECPAKLNGTYTFELTPAPESSSSGCRAYGSYGYYVNGVPLWSWTDSASYNSAGIWNNLAMSFEQYDMDVCLGHGAQDTYHHHSYSPCLAERLSDTGTSHSPIYGWAYDGYPIYGPYQSANTLAVPCWQARDYSASSVTGCSDGKRSCQLVDEFDYTKGTTTASSSGPSLTGTTSTQSSNTISAVSGIYYEDYFYNATCGSKGGQYLNQYNGHDHDSYGFHYHLTIDSSGTPLFPYSIGPKYYGCMPRTRVCCANKKCTSTSTSTCGTTSGSTSLQCKTSAPTPMPTTSSPTLTRSPTKTPTLSPTSSKPTTRTPTRSPTGPTYAPSILPTYSSSDRIDYSCLHSTAWLLNTNGDYNSYFNSLTNILTSKYDTTSRPGKRQWSLTYHGIPNYDHIMTTSDIDAINARPRASTEFSSTNGVTTAVAGDLVTFGDNIGYVATECTIGYWPPGPVCPIAENYTQSFVLTPSWELSSTGCYGKGQYGIYVNGAGLWSWADGGSYNSEKIWNSLAGAFEYYDVDFCNGHAAQGDYHHHGWSMCLAEKLGDVGNNHSPIYGFANDGFPIYGPYQSANALAVSCWQARDYSSTSPTGCSDSARSCQLVDEFDYTKGTVAVAEGPSLTSTMTTSTFNVISSASGIYYEDYFYNATCGNKGGQYLSQYNGHDHDSYGFHYHLTIDSSGTPLFPYSIGPKYYGCLSGVPCCADHLCTISGTSSCGSSPGSSTSSCTTAVTGSTPTITPTTLSQLTSVPTVVPTSRSPTTSAPSTSAPTVTPTTRLPSTASPSSRSPTARAPTLAPSTRSPTFKPSTRAPSTRSPTFVPSTRSPTVSPSTITPTLLPTTTAPTRLPSALPSSNQPSVSPSRLPSTTVPSTTAPTTSAPSLSPTSMPPTTLSPTTLLPSTASPTTRSPSTLTPSTRVPSTTVLNTLSPSTLFPTSRAPTTVLTEMPATDVPTTSSPLATPMPTTTVPSSVPSIAYPTSELPLSANPTPFLTSTSPSSSQPTVSSWTSESPTPVNSSQSPSVAVTNAPSEVQITDTPSSSVTPSTTPTVLFTDTQYPTVLDPLESSVPSSTPSVNNVSVSPTTVTSSMSPKTDTITDAPTDEPSSSSEVQSHTPSIGPTAQNTNWNSTPSIAPAATIMPTVAPTYMSIQSAIPTSTTESPVGIHIPSQIPTGLSTYKSSSTTSIIPSSTPVIATESPTLLSDDDTVDTQSDGNNETSTISSGGVAGIAIGSVIGLAALSIAVKTTIIPMLFTGASSVVVPSPLPTVDIESVGLDVLPQGSNEIIV